MAKIQEPEIEESIETEEEEDESSKEEGSDDETPQPNIQSLSSIHPNPPSSSSDDAEESDSGSDAPVKRSNPGIRSPATDLPKPTAASSARKPKSKTETALPTSPAKPGAKRPAEKEVETKESKKSKKLSGSTEGVNNSGIKGPSASAVINNDPKKQLFQRLWSEEDEIVILNGMMDYSAKEKVDTVADFGAFLEFIKKSLHIQVTKTQLQDKVRKLKRKFANNTSKEKTGKERTFSNPHEQKIYELSKKIWGNPSINNGNVGDEKVPETPKVSGSVVRKSRSKNVPNLNEVEDHVEVVKIGSISSSLCYSSVSEWILNDGAKMVEREKREEMEEKWKKIQKQEVEVFLKRTELMCEQTKLVLEAMRKSEH